MKDSARPKKYVMMNIVVGYKRDGRRLLRNKRRRKEKEKEGVGVELGKIVLIEVMC